jgi:hypothetical protein
LRAITCPRPYRAVRAERLGLLQLGGGLTEPEVGVALPAGQVGRERCVVKQVAQGEHTEDRAGGGIAAVASYRRPAVQRDASDQHSKPPRFL